MNNIDKEIYQLFFKLSGLINLKTKGNSLQFTLD
jgi:hypothetical protein